MSSDKCRFDDSLPWLVEVLVAELGPDLTSSGVILRDASGRLAFFIDAELGEEELHRVSERIRSRIGEYARPDRVLTTRDASGWTPVTSHPHVRALNVAGRRLRYLDRRIVGSDWLMTPVPASHHPLRIVFSSLKGGVGRSTALSVVAAEQARRSRNVLVVDLDLEAPGIGSLLLTNERRPRFGVVDFLVESNFESNDSELLDGMIDTSPLTSGAGLVDVVPVFGTRSKEAPGNYLAKLSLSMTEGPPDGDVPATVARKVSLMLEALEKRRAYDVVLIDARAGLAELAAGPLLALGATVLQFGTWHRHTLEGLTFLFSHLASLVADGQPSPWQQLKMVHAKAQHSQGHEQFKDALWGLFSDYIYEELDGLEGFNFDVNTPEAPHYPIPIPLDIAFADWDPVSEPAKLVEPYYSRTFGSLVDYVEDLLIRQGPR